MAIVKITSRTRNRARAKATIRYIVHRRELEGERITRSLYGREGECAKLEAYERIDKAGKSTTFFRITISPDPKREDRGKDLNLRELTEKTLHALQLQFPNQQLHFFAAIHGHTDKRHVNLLALLNGRLTPKHLKLLRETATGNANEQRQQLDQAQGQYLGQRPPRQAQTVPAGGVQSTFAKEMRTGGAAKIPPLCPVCRTPMEMHGSTIECGNCGMSLGTGASLNLTKSYSHGLTLGLEEAGE
jgi:hypothetical protein